MYRSLLAALSASSVLSVLPVPAAAGDVGLRILAQPWTPYTDDETVHTVIDHPTLVSGGLHTAWTWYEQTIHDVLGSALGTGDLLYPEVTLYDIDLRIPEPVLTVTGAGGGSEPLLLEAEVVLDDLHLEATSTTPDVAFGIGFGEYADPRCSIDFDVTVTVPVGIGSDVSAPLYTDITPAQAGERPIVRISDFRVDSQNLPCDILVEVMEALDLDDLLTAEVTDPTSETASSLNAAAIGLLTDALGSVNAEIAAVVPPGLVRVNAWAPASNVPLTLAFGVDATVWPADGLNGGQISGTFVSSTGTMECAYVPVAIARKTGPRPIVTPSGMLGELPTEPLERIWDCYEVDGVMHYTLGGLSQSFPTVIGVQSSTICDPSDPSSIAYTRWVRGFGARVLPTDLGGEFPITGDNFELYCGSPTSQLPGVEDIFDTIDDPLLDPVLPTSSEWWLEGWVYTGLASSPQLQLHPLSLDAYQYGL